MNPSRHSLSSAIAPDVILPCPGGRPRAPAGTAVLAYQRVCITRGGFPWTCCTPLFSYDHYSVLCVAKKRSQGTEHPRVSDGDFTSLFHCHVLHKGFFLAIWRAISIPRP